MKTGKNNPVYSIQKLLPHTWYDSASYSIISRSTVSKGYLNIRLSWSSTSLPGNKGLPALVISGRKKITKSFNPVSSDNGRLWDHTKFLKISGWENICLEGSQSSPISDNDTYCIIHVDQKSWIFNISGVIFFNHQNNAFLTCLINNCTSWTNLNLSCFLKAYLNCWLKW